MMNDKMTRRELAVVAFMVLHFVVLVSTYLLSLFSAINPRNIISVWIFLFIVVLAWGGYQCQGRNRIADRPTEINDWDFWSIVFFIGVVILISASLLSAAFSVPASQDVLAYHLSQVMHWVQNGSVMDYPTHITRQLFSQSLSSFVQLHLLILCGSDILANVPQFLSMVLTLMIVSLLCKEMRFSRCETLLSLLIVASLPLGILQSSSALNDYSLTLWVLCFVYFGYKYKRTSDFILLILSVVALAFICLTKISGIILILPFLIYFLISTPIEHENKLGYFLFLGGVFLLLVLPWFIHLLSIRELLTTPYFFSPYSNVLWPLHSLQEMLGNAYHHLLSELTFVKPDEEFASSPVHMMLVVLLVGYVFFRFKVLERKLLGYILMVVVGCLLTTLVIRYNLVVNRFHLPCFILLAPALAYMIYRERFLWFTVPLLFCSGIYVATIYSTRPLIGQNSIVTTPRNIQLTRNLTGVEWDFAMASQRIANLGFRQIGLIYDQYGNQTNMQREYLLWKIMGYRYKDYRIEHIMVNNASKHFTYSRGMFKPDVILVTSQQAKALSIEFQGKVYVLSQRVGKNIGIYY